MIAESLTPLEVVGAEQAIELTEDFGQDAILTVFERDALLKAAKFGLTVMHTRNSRGPRFRVSGRRLTDLGIGVYSDA